jgi:hypothetical protein
MSKIGQLGDAEGSKGWLGYTRVLLRRDECSE